MKAVDMPPPDVFARSVRGDHCLYTRLRGKMDDSNLAKFKRELDTFCDAAAQAVEFIDQSHRNEKVALAADYSLISGFVRPHRPRGGASEEGFDRDIDQVGRRIFELYQTHAEDTPYRLVFSQPTVMEFNLSNERLASDIQNLIRQSKSTDALYDAFMKYIETDGSPNVITDQALYTYAKHAFDAYSRVFRPDGLSNLLLLMKEGYIHGLGRYFTTEEFNSRKPQIYTLTRKIWDALNSRKHRSLSEYQYFNNLVDALNLSISYQLDQIRNDVSISYLAPMPPGLEDNDTRAALRHRSLPAAPLLDLSARSFTAKTANPKREAEEWIISGLERAQPVRKFLSKINSVSEMSDVRKYETQLFYQDYLKPTFGPGGAKLNVEWDFSQARKLFTDKNEFRRRFEETEVFPSAATVALSDLEPLIESDELLSDMGLADDPKIQAILNKLRNNN